VTFWIFILMATSMATPNAAWVAIPRATRSTNRVRRAVVPRVCVRAAAASVTYTAEDLGRSFVEVPGDLPDEPQRTPQGTGNGVSDVPMNPSANTTKTKDAITPPAVDLPVTEPEPIEESVVLQDGARAASAPWVPFSPAGSVCFEVVLDLTDGFESAGVSFEPGPDGRPKVKSVPHNGHAHGELMPGDVLLETTAVVMVADTTGASKHGVATKTYAARFPNPDTPWRPDYG
jgi:hypothetical protein|tara:strand:+ start:1025 stop:1720 length:696 start_codon:yes stop_codon:yes gene_type:complete